MVHIIEDLGPEGKESFIQLNVLKNRFISVSEIRNKLWKHGIKVSVWTIRRRLRECGLGK